MNTSSLITRCVVSPPLAPRIAPVLTPGLISPFSLDSNHSPPSYPLPTYSLYTSLTVMQYL